MIIAPSILACAPERLIEDTSAMFSFGAVWTHIDIMDGKFVPNSTFPPSVVSTLRDGVPHMFRDVHLMVFDVEQAIDDFASHGAESITFHLEACKDEAEARAHIAHIRSLGIKVGISIKPKTPVEDLLPYLNDVDMVLIMSVEPGFGGQKFMPQAADKIAFLAGFRKENGLNYLIEVDGGINFETGKICADAGVDVLVAGSYLYGKIDAEKRVKELLAL